MVRSDSRTRILDAAERLFGEKGMRATTLREIGAAAKANTGSIYFHFKTKGDLIREVFRRRLEPLDAERLARLEAHEDPSLRDILECWVEPLLGLTRSGNGGIHFLGVLGRTYSELDPEIVRMLSRDHGATHERFIEALAQALPKLPEEQRRLRFHFALGSIAHTLGSDVTWRIVLGRRPAAGAWERVLGELMPFLVAGFEAPLPEDPGARTRGAA